MKQKLAILFIILLASTLYALTLRGVLGNPTSSDFKNKLDQRSMPFELSPERGRYVHLVSLADYGHFNLTKELAEAAFPDVGVYDGRFYSYFAPGLPYLAYPMYLLGAKYGLAQVSSFAFVSIVSILALIFLFRIAREILQLPVWASLASVFIFAFGSTAWSYAITLYQHHVTTFFMASSFYAVWRFRKGTRASVFWAGYACFIYGLAITIDYPNALLLLPIMIYLGLSTFLAKKEGDRIHVAFRAEVLLSLLCFFAITGAHFYHNTIHYGAWNHLSGGLQSYRFIDPTLDPVKAASQGIQPQDLNAQKNIVGFFKEERLPFSSYTLLISPDRGLLVYAPVFLFSIFGMIWIYRRKMSLDMAVLFGIIGMNLFLYSSWGDPWGGWAYGPRYLIPSMAFLSLFIGVSLSQLRRSLLIRIALFPFCIYSSAVALLGALTTNAVPPKIEADFLHMKYNFFFNWDLLREGQSGSFVYNTFVSGAFNLEQYFAAIVIVIVVVMFSLLFIFPYFEQYD